MDIKLEFGAAIEAMTGEVDKLHKGFMDEWRRANPKPRYFTLRGQASSSASATTPFQVDLGGPTVGYMWDVMGIATAGADDHTSVAGTVGLYAGDLTSVSLVSLVAPNFVIPVYQSIGKDRIWVQPGQELFANVAGVANNQLVTVIAHIAEWRQVDKLPTGVA